MKPLALTSALYLLTAATASAAKPDAPVSLDGLSWLSGAWVQYDGRQRIEETWSAPANDMLIGMSRTLRDGKTSAFEFLRIVARDDGVFYVAQPQGRPPVEFRLQSLEGKQAVFVNPGNADHLQRIVYRRNADGSLAARVEGADGDKSFAQDYLYHRAPARKP